MNFNTPPFLLSSIARHARLLALPMVFAANSAYADQQDITLSNNCNGNTELSYASQPNQVVMNEIIGVGGANGSVEWSIDAVEQTCTLGGAADTILCGGLTITVPAGSVAASTKVTIAGTSSANTTEGKFTLSVGDGTNSCSRKYVFRVTQKGGGWGDPHITTTDDVHYDFQSAGEFTALRENGFEVQTRQTPVPTASIPNANPYTGLASCVSIYTAVAARIGTNRVTLQPDGGGDSNPNRGLQLRVNGQLVTLPDNGIDLPGEQAGILDGRIVPVGASYQITDARGTQLVVAPAFWDSQQRWYLNVNVYHTTATAGIMGRLAEGSWLPALPNGTSLGPMPESLNERYQQLYEQFADAWRVTNATSLFDYAPGTNTATFTLDEWPRHTPKSCALEGQVSEMPATPEVAAEACKGVTDAGQRADCIFDVTFTGHTGFGPSYEAMQNIRPNPTGWQPPLAVQTPVPPPPKLPWWFWILIVILTLILIIVLFLRKKTA